MEQNNTSYESILKQAAKKETSPFKFSKTYPAYIVLVVMLIISFFVWNQANEQVANDRRAEFDKAVSSVMTRLETKFQRKEEVITSMNGLYDILVDVVRDYFDLYGQVPTKTYPSIVSIDFVPYVPDEELGMFIFNAKSSGYYDYEIKDPKNRGYFYPILHSVPLERNYHRLGTDLANNEIIKTAIEKARDNNSIVSSPILEFRDDTTGFMLIAPNYDKDKKRNDIQSRRANFQGVVIIEILAEMFFQNAITGGNKNSLNTFPTDSTIVFEIIDTSGTEDILVFRSENGNVLDTEYEKFVTDTLAYPIADRNLLIKFATVPGFGGEFQRSMPTIALIVSLILSILFFAFVLSVTTSRARAVDLADRMTRSQRRIVDSSQDIIAVLDFDGNWKSMNPASLTVFGTSPDDMINTSILPLFYSEEDKAGFLHIAENISEDKTERVDLKMRHSGGNMKWISWSLTISQADRLIYAIGRDVTAEKKAEEEAHLKTKQIQLAEQFAREASESKTYFMTKLSHMMRNSLTGMMGYLQLLSNKIYETEEEHDSYIKMAEDSTEEIFTFVSDIVDAAIGSDENNAQLEFIQLEEFFNSLFKDVDKVSSKTVSFDGKSSSFKAKAVADKNILHKSLADSINALLIDSHGGDIQVQASENKHESATEVQILLPVSPIAEEMIKVFKNSSDPISALREDQHEIILTLALSASNIRRMNGSFEVANLGKGAGSIIQFTLPMNKIIEE